MLSLRSLRCELLFCLLFAGACAPQAPTASAQAVDSPAPVPEFKLSSAQLQTWERVLRLTGELATFEQATVSAKVAGRVMAPTVDVGSQVKAGELLFRIEARDFELRLSQAQASLEAARALLGPGALEDVERAAIVREVQNELDQARRELDRRTSLLAHGDASQSAIDESQTALSAAESRLQTAREVVANRRATLTLREVEVQIAQQQLDDTLLTAPFDGVIAERLVGTGDYLSIGTPLARLQRNDPLRLRLNVPEYAVGELQLGQEVRASFDSGVDSVPAQLQRFAPALGSRDRSLMVEADLPNPDGALRPGMFARAEWVLDPQAQALVIPPEALVRFAGIDKVFVVEGELAQERRIQVGREEGPRIEVLEGLQAGERIVLSPGRLQNGARIRVRQDN
jgi:RND family efflux transporter MFP subunit